MRFPPAFLFKAMAAVLCSAAVWGQTISITGLGTITGDSVRVPNSAQVAISGLPGGLFYTLDGTEPDHTDTRYTALLQLGYGVHDLRVVTYSSDLSQELRRRLLITVAPTFTLRINTPFNELVTVTSVPPPQNGAYFSNSVITVSARSGNGWIFKEYRYMRRTTEPTIQFTLRSNIFLKLIYQTRFHATNDGPGVVRVSPAKEFYEYDEQVTLHADPEPRSFFTRWSIMDRYEPWVHSVTQPDQTVVGSFQRALENQVVLDTDVVGGGGVIATTPGRYVFFPGETVTVLCGRINGAFYGWVQGNQSPTQSIQFIISEDTKLVARSDRIFKWAAHLDTRAGMNPVAVHPDGTIYATTDSYLWAVSPEGDIKWAVTAPGLSWPAIGPSGALYMAGGTGLVSYAPNGTFRWEYPGGVSSVAIDQEENLYFIHGSELASVNRAGEFRWTTAGAGLQRVAPSLSRDGVVVAVNKQVIQVAYDSATGDFKWAGPEHPIAPGEAGAVGSNGTFNFQSDNRLYSIFSDGLTNFVAPAPYSHLYQSLTVAPNGAVYLAVNYIFSDNFEVLRYSPNGQREWARTGAVPPLIDSANLLYYMQPTGAFLNIDLLNSDGSSIYKAQVQGAGGWATLGIDNTIIFSGSGNKISAVQAPNGPNPEAWSTFRGNAQRTGSLLAIQTNFPPLAPAITNQIVETGGRVTIPLLLSDDHTPAEDLSIVAISLDESLIPAESLRVIGEGATRTLEILAPSNSSGLGRIRLTITDESGLYVAREFLVEIRAARPAPELLVDLVPALTLKGVPGERYRIEMRPKAEAGDWTLLKEVELTNSVQNVYVDLGVLESQPRYYRAILQ